MGVEVTSAAGKAGIVARLEGLSYSGHAIGAVFGNNQPRYSIDLAASILDAGTNPEKAAWLVTCRRISMERGSVAQWGAERRNHLYYLVDAYKDAESSEASDDAWLALTEFVLLALGAYDFEGLGTAASGSQIRVLDLDHDPDRAGFGGRMCYHATYALELMNAAAPNT